MVRLLDGDQEIASSAGALLGSLDQLSLPSLWGR